MIKGPIVMMGYYGDETATRETIEPDGWLHTGDLASVDEVGQIFVVDRITGSPFGLGAMRGLPRIAPSRMAAKMQKG